MKLNSKFNIAKRLYYKRKSKYPGSITVEAAFVMPIVLLTVFALIYLSFYLHDINRIQSVMDLAIHKAGLTVKHEADIATGRTSYNNINDRGVFFLLLGSTAKEEEQIKNYLGQKLTTGLFLTKVRGIDVDVGKSKLSILVKTETKVSLPGIKFLFFPVSKKVLESEYPVHNPAEAIRCMEVILKTGSQVKGVDKLKEKLDKIFGTKQ